MNTDKTVTMLEGSIGSASGLWLSNFVEIYQKLSTENLDLLSKIYHQDVVFKDPIHNIEGFDELSSYFNGLYENLSYCDFKIKQVLVQDNQAAIYWDMHFKHTRLNGGELVNVEGSSHIKGLGDKVIYHRDYLDLGSML